MRTLERGPLGLVHVLGPRCQTQQRSGVVADHVVGLGLGVRLDGRGVDVFQHIGITGNHTVGHAPGHAGNEALHLNTCHVIEALDEVRVKGDIAIEGGRASLGGCGYLASHACGYGFGKCGFRLNTRTLVNSFQSLGSRLAACLI